MISLRATRVNALPLAGPLCDAWQLKRGWDWQDGCRHDSCWAVATGRTS